MAALHTEGRHVSADAAWQQIGDALLDAYDIYQQDRFAAILTATAAATTRLGAPAFIGAMMYDPPSDTWHFQTLLTPAARPIDTNAVGVPAEAFRGALSVQDEAQPLEGIFGDAWGAERCARIEQRLGTTAAIALPIYMEDAVRGALLALFAEPRQGRLLVGLLAHATLAAGRYLASRPTLPGLGLGLTDPQELIKRAESEIARAQRYRRQVGVVLCEQIPASTLPQLGAQALPRLRTWDIAGLLPDNPQSLVIVLPETARTGTLGLMRRLNRDTLGTQIGAAVMPDDGDRFSALLAVARRRARATSSTLWETPAEQEAVLIFTLGTPAGPGNDTVRCPHCLTPYTWRPPTGAAVAMIDQLRAQMRDTLMAACPSHPDRIDLPRTEEKEKPRGLFGRRR